MILEEAVSETLTADVRHPLPSRVRIDVRAPAALGLRPRVRLPSNPPEIARLLPGQLTRKVRGFPFPSEGIGGTFTDFDTLVRRAFSFTQYAYAASFPGRLWTFGGGSSAGMFKPSTFHLRLPTRFDATVKTCGPVAWLKLPVANPPEMTLVPRGHTATRALARSGATVARDNLLAGGSAPVWQ